MIGLWTILLMVKNTSFKKWLVLSYRLMADVCTGKYFLHHDGHLLWNSLLLWLLRSRAPWAPWPPWSQWEEAGSARLRTEEGTGPGSHGSSSAPRGHGLGPPYPDLAWPKSSPAPACSWHRWMANTETPAHMCEGKLINCFLDVKRWQKHTSKWWLKHVLLHSTFW